MSGDAVTNPPLTLLQGIAAFALWQTGRFDTLDIADVMQVKEAEVANLIGKVMDSASSSPQPPQLRVVEGGRVISAPPVSGKPLAGAPV